MRILLILFLFSTTALIFSQESIEIQEPTYIKSVQLRPARANAYLPIIKLGERIVLHFDDLEGDEKYYEYKVEHCTYDWQISNIASSVYSDGFTSDNIREFENSFNTFQNYTHYSLSIPNSNFRLKISGNYLLSVLNEDEEIVFTRKFVVYQPKVAVGVTVHKARRIESINTKQNVEFIINHPDLLINNPSKEIKVAIYQNNDWNTLVTDIEPQFFRGTQLIYKYGDKTTFWGNNEFLFFDSKDVRSATNNVRRVYLDDLFQTRLYADASRINNPYTFYPDINGNFVVRTINVEDVRLEAEYTNVHFFYELNETDFNPEVSGDIYVYGNFNNWQLTNENKLTFNSKTGFYETNILLKQGFYNYTYVSVDSDNFLDLHTLEGSHFQTENEYNVLVYYRKFGSRYDQAIGFGAGSSVNLQN